MKSINIVSVSGGKDSTATYLLAIDVFGNDFIPVFADTGHEHPVTINYIKNLHLMAAGPEVNIVTSNFKKQLQKKGIEETGNQFLDMMLWKGRAPSTKAQFCTENLKLWPIRYWLDKNYPQQEYDYAMFLGIRRGESRNRSTRECVAWNGFFDCMEYLPFCYASAKDIFDYLKEKGVPPNPLYALGFKRVGCFPCIHANKGELALLPDWAWERLQYYEDNLHRSWFPAGYLPGKEDGHIPRIGEVREWCKTVRGGKQYDIFKSVQTEDSPACFSGWICE